MKGSTELHRLIGTEHERKWVALTRDKTKVVAFDESLVKLKEKVGATPVTYMKVPPSDVYLSL
jgi:hypothetical protein